MSGWKENPGKYLREVLLFERYTYLDDVKDKIYKKGGKIDILLGNDQAYLLRDHEILQSPVDPHKNPIAVTSVLGWCL